MAIDTKSLTQIITEFRKLQAKDSITPESLGYILQRLADLLATAGTSETVNSIQTLLNGFKAAGQAVVSLQQGAADRNNILANIKTVDLGNGSIGLRFYLEATEGIIGGDFVVDGVVDDGTNVAQVNGY